MARHNLHTHVLPQAQSLVGTLPPLLVEALQTAQTLTFGAHGRKRPGPGDTFYQYRPYQSPESAAGIDWRASARRDTPLVRQNEWEAAQSVFLWVDHSPSMDWRSHKSLPTKLHRAQVLALATASLLLRGQEQVGTLDGTIAPNHDTTTLVRLCHSFEHQPAHSLPPLRELPHRAHVLLVGDFLPQAEGMAAWLKQIAFSGVKLLLLEVTDPAEETFAFKGPTLFEGLELEGELEVGDPKALRRLYLERRENLRTALAAQTRRAGGTYLTHVTGTPAPAALRQVYTYLGGA